MPTLVEHKLLGLLPLDPDDEGLDPVGIAAMAEDIFRFFETGVQDIEIAQAHSLIAEIGASRKK